MGLANPDAGASGSGPMSPRKEKGKEGPFLRVRIGVLERNRKDLLIRFDANVSNSFVHLDRYPALPSGNISHSRPICPTTERAAIGTCKDPTSNSSDSQNRYK
jgi:hypothetical protein